MRSLALAAALSLAPTLALAQSTEIPGSAFEAGNWAGGAYTDDRGAFSYCYITVSYQNGQDLWIGLYPNDTLSILLRQPDVKFKPGQKFELWVMMETGIPAIGNGEAWDADYGGITYDGVQATVDFLNSGRYLRMLGMGIDDGFDVDGIGPALAQAQDCLARQGGAGGGKVLVHCMGGCGRSGMAVLRLMVETGEPPHSALSRLRAARPCAVETDAQFDWAVG